jgi:hypothetical protein
MGFYELREQLAGLFSVGELRVLCVDLGVDYDDLPGEGKAAKAGDLMLYLRRRGRLAALATQVDRLRPHADWGARLRAAQSTRPDDWTADLPKGGLAVNQEAREGGRIERSGIRAKADMQGKIEQRASGEGSAIDDSPIELD